MNILGICHFELYQYYSSSFVHRQAVALAHKGNRVRVIVLTPFGKKNVTHRFSFKLRNELRDDVEIFYLRYLSLSKWGTKGFNNKSSILASKFFWNRLYNDFLPDIVHVHNIGMSYFGSHLKKAFNCPVIATTHGSDTNVPYNNGDYKTIVSNCKSLDGIVAVSTSLKNRLIESGVKTSCRVILNGFERSEVKRKKDPNSWIQVCHLIPQKHVDITIKQFYEYCRWERNATLTIIGEGPDRESLENLVDSMGISRQVKFTGFLDNEEVLKIMAASEYYVMISSPEGLGIVYLEALSMGCITFGTIGEGIEDVIKSGENGYLVPLDDPSIISKTINELTHNPNKKETISKNAKKSVQDLSWENNALQLTDFFEEIREEYV